MSFNEFISTLLKAIITTAVPIITTYVVKFLQNKNACLKKQTKNDTLIKYLDIAFGIVEDAVISTNQTYVENLKKTDSFDSNAQMEAFKKTVNTATSLMSKECEEAITEVYGDLNKWLTIAIEQKVNSLKG